MSYKSYEELGVGDETGKDQYSVVSIENEQEKNDLVMQNRFVCVEVYADWCGPCKQIAPDYSMLANKYSKKGFVLVKELYDKKLSSGIQGVPTFRFFVDGKETDQVVGADLQEVDGKITEILSSYSSVSQMRGPPAGRNTVRAKTGTYQGQSMRYPEDQYK